MSWDSANKASIVISIGAPCAILLRNLLYGILKLQRDPSLNSGLSEELERLLARAEEFRRDLQEKDFVVRTVVNIRDPQFLVRFTRELGRCVHVSAPCGLLLLISIL